MSEPRGSIYNLTLVDTEIRAEGMHHAHAIEKALRVAIADTLAGDPYVLEVESGPHVRMTASPKNFAPRKEHT